jgi:hypothetical protein
MNPARLSSLSWVWALALSSACAGCSSGKTAALDSGPPGDGGACPARTDETVAVKIRMSVTWPATAGFVRGTGPYVIWLLSRYAIDGQNNITSTTRICQIGPPAITQSSGPDLALSVPVGFTKVSWLASPVSEWKKVTKTTVATGVLGGWAIGSSIAIHPSVSLFGLKDSSQYKDAATPWPSASSDPYPFGTAPDYEDEEGDGTPGITVLPMEEGLPASDGLPTEDAGPSELPVDLSEMPGRNADRIFEATRIELSLYGTSTSCVAASGKADVSLIDARIIGCRLAADGGLCTRQQTGLVDSNWPPYKPGPATFEQVVLMAGASATCDDVVAALPDTDASGGG